MSLKYACIVSHYPYPASICKAYTRHMSLWNSLVKEIKPIMGPQLDDVQDYFKTM